MTHDLNLLEMVVVVFYSIAVGLLSSMLGIGGGFINSPLLVVLFGFSLQHAPATSLAAIIFMSLSTSLAFALQREKNPTKYKIGMLVALVTIPGSITGVLIRNALGTNPILSLLFALCLMPIALKMFFFPKRPRRKAENASLDPISPSTALGKNKITIGIVVGFVGGFSSGLLGIGGGVIVVPLLGYLGLTMYQAVATSAFTMIFTSIAGTILNLLLGGFSIGIGSVPGPLSSVISITTPGYVHFDYVIVLAAGMIIGAQFGARIVKKIPTVRLQQLFGIVMIFPLVRVTDLSDRIVDLLPPPSPGSEAVLKLLVTFIIWSITTVFLVIVLLLNRYRKRKGQRESKDAELPGSLVDSPGGQT